MKLEQNETHTKVPGEVFLKYSESSHLMFLLHANLSLIVVVPKKYCLINFFCCLVSLHRICRIMHNVSIECLALY
jgi:hypothetical protein